MSVQFFRGVFPRMGHLGQDKRSARHGLVKPFA